MNDVLRIARLKIALQRAFLGRAILRVIVDVMLVKSHRFRFDVPISKTALDMTAIQIGSLSYFFLKKTCPPNENTSENELPKEKT